MMFSFKNLAVVVLLLLTLLVGFTIQAQEGREDVLPFSEIEGLHAQASHLLATDGNLAAFWEQLTPEQQRSLEYYLFEPILGTPIITSSNEVSLEQSQSLENAIVSAAAGCHWVQVEVPYYHPPPFQNNKMFAYYQRVDWCYDGSNVTSINARPRWGESWTCFVFEGHIGDNEAGGAGQPSYYAFTQGRFHCDFGDQTATPWIEQTVYGNGTHTESGHH